MSTPPDSEGFSLVQSAVHPHSRYKGVFQADDNFDKASMEALESSSIMIERADSGRTDESPFGSSLTTPIDENVELFGIEERLFAGDRVASLEPSESVMCLGTQDGLHVIPQTLSKAGVQARDLSEGTLLEDKLLAFESLNSVVTSSPPFNKPHLTSKQINGSVRSTRPRSGSIYNLPNKPINDDDEAEMQLLPETDKQETYNFLTREIIDDNTPESLSPVLIGEKQSAEINKSLSPVTQPTESTDIDDEYNFSALPFALEDPDFSLRTEIDDLSAVSFPKLTLQTLLPTILRVALFVPWCIVVGATIVLFPSYLELVVFGTGYISPPHGIRRFAHWADTGKEFIGIFLGFVACLGWLFPKLGLLLAGGIIAQFLYAWQGFVVDLNIPLGENDKQSIYLVATEYFSSDLVNVCKTGYGYRVSRVGEVQH